MKRRVEKRRGTGLKESEGSTLLEMNVTICVKERQERQVCFLFEG